MELIVVARIHLVDSAEKTGRKDTKRIRVKAINVMLALYMKWL